MMAYHGTLLRVYDNAAKTGGKLYWGVVIDTDEKGDVTSISGSGSMPGSRARNILNQSATCIR